MYNNDEIIDGLSRNDHIVVKNLYREYYPVISGWIKKNSGSRDDADDVFQEALVILLNKLREKGIDLKCSFSTYLFSICKNLWFQELRRRHRECLSDMLEFTELTDLDSSKELEERKFRIFLNQVSLLEAKCIQLFLLYCQKKPLSEIMHRLGFINEQAVADKRKTVGKNL